LLAIGASFTIKARNAFALAVDKKATIGRLAPLILGLLL
jgi:hypothetical protein